MRPAKKTSPVKKPRGGGPVPRPSKRGPGVTGKRPPPRPRQQKKQVLGAFGERMPEVKGGRPPPKGSSAVKQRKLSPAALRSKRLKEKESLNKYAESLPLKKRGRDNKLLSKAEALRERRLRAAALRQKRLKEKKATPIKPENIIDKTPRGGVDPRLTAARRRQAAALRRRRAVAAPKGKDIQDFGRKSRFPPRKAAPKDKHIQDIGRTSPYKGKLTAKAVRDRFPVSRRIRQR
jgi:hypothetical protein